MKFQLTFKTPGVLSLALDAEEYSRDNCDCTEGCIHCELREDAARLTQEAMEQVAKLFIQYGEIIKVEFDTDKRTATVLPLPRK